MSSPSILFIPANATGHIHSLIGIADRMKVEFGYDTIFLLPTETNVRSIENNGHKLMIATSKDLKDLVNQEKYCQTTIFQDNFNSLLKDIRDDPIEAIINMWKCKTGFTRILIDRMIENDDIFTSLISQIKPKLIVLDSWFIPPSVLKHKDIPFVYVNSVNPLNVTNSKRSDGAKPQSFTGCRLLANKQERERLSREDPQEWQAILNQWNCLTQRFEECRQFRYEAFDKMYKDIGFEPHEPHFNGSYFSPHLNVYMFPREVDYDQEDDLLDYPARFFRCDSLIRHSSAKTDSDNARAWLDKIEQRRQGKSAVVYFSLGTLASADLELLNRHLSFMSQDKERLYVVSTGVRGHQVRLCEDNMVGDKYLPQTAILQQVDLAVIHGGNNSVTECLHFGVPMIVLPCFGDQLDNAQRIEDLGLGRRLNVALSSRIEFMGAIDDLLSNQQVRDRVRCIGEKMRARDDTRKLAIILDKLAREGHLEQSFIEYCRNRHPDEIEALK